MGNHEIGEREINNEMERRIKFKGAYDPKTVVNAASLPGETFVAFRKKSRRRYFELHTKDDSGKKSDKITEVNEAGGKSYVRYKIKDKKPEPPFDAISDSDEIEREFDPNSKTSMRLARRTQEKEFSSTKVKREPKPIYDKDKIGKLLLMPWGEVVEFCHDTGVVSKDQPNPKHRALAGETIFVGEIEAKRTVPREEFETQEDYERYKERIKLSLEAAAEIIAERLEKKGIEVETEIVDIDGDLVTRTAVASSKYKWLKKLERKISGKQSISPKSERRFKKVA